MKPYYHNSKSGVTLYLGDCRAVLPTLPRASVDLIVTDPPYGVNWQSGFRAVSAPFPHLAGDDGTADVIGALRLALDALKDHRHLYVFGRFDLSALPLTATAELIWDKECIGMGNLDIPWGPGHEVILFAMYAKRIGRRAIGQRTLSVRRRQGSVLRCPRLNATQVQDHPTEKPVPLLRMLIESSSVLGETVLDPFAGSGSTLVAAVLEGRNAVGIEIDEGYCEKAARRLDALPLPLLEVAG